MTRGHQLVAAGVVVAVVAVGVGAWRWQHRAVRAAALAPVFAPLPRKVTVEVLNSGRVSGAARVGTVLIRATGLDVVYYATADSNLSGRERNQVLVRRGDTLGVGRIVAALGAADVIDARDPSRLVDLTVLLGRNFAPPRVAHP